MCMAACMCTCVRATFVRILGNLVLTLVVSFPVVEVVRVQSGLTFPLWILVYPGVWCSHLSEMTNYRRLPCRALKALVLTSPSSGWSGEKTRNP